MLLLKSKSGWQNVNKRQFHHFYLPSPPDATCPSVCLRVIFSLVSHPPLPQGIQHIKSFQWVQLIEPEMVARTTALRILVLVLPLLIKVGDQKRREHCVDARLKEREHSLTHQKAWPPGWKKWYIIQQGRPLGFQTQVDKMPSSLKLCSFWVKKLAHGPCWQWHFRLKLNAQLHTLVLLWSGMRENRNREALNLWNESSVQITGHKTFTSYYVLIHYLFPPVHLKSHSRLGGVDENTYCSWHVLNARTHQD